MAKNQASRSPLDPQAALSQNVAGNVARVIPEGERRFARISHIVLTDSELILDNLRSVRNGRSDRVCHGGTYARLHTRPVNEDGVYDMEHWELVMSDTPYELRAGLGFKAEAHGHVLILGLGLGATTIPVMMKPNVKKITVIERNDDVIGLVGPHLQELEGGEKLDIFHANAFTWKPPKGMRFNTIWVDIWPDISTDNLTEVTKLKRRYCHWLDRSDPDAKLLVWEEWFLRAERRREKAREWF